MIQAPPPARRFRGAFSLVELLVSMVVLIILVGLIALLFSSASSVISTGNKQMDSDAQTRAVFDRMSIDFAQMVKRPDVDYYLKSSGNPQPGNDQIAFYSLVPGYYLPAANSQSSVSLVAYRVNGDSGSGSYNKLQRLGTGLVWNGSAPGSPIVFLPQTISANWPAATNMAADDNYELAGPSIFRMEYHYVLKGQLAGSATYASRPSDTPWDVRIAGHTAIDGLRDVVAIAFTIAVIDPMSRILISDDKLANLAGNMPDFTDGSEAGAVESQWRTAINNEGLPGPVSSSIRIYSRYFQLPSNSIPE